MDDKVKQEYLDEHIPYRMRFFEMLRIACEILLSGKRPAKVEVMFDGCSVLSANSIYLITNPLLEVGTIYSRVMLEFLGIKYDQGRSSLVARTKRDRKSRSRDIVIEDFDVEKISVSDAVTVPFEKDREKVKQALIGAILLAHKGIAHFTTDPVESAGLQGLHLCSKIVPWLVCQHLYGKLGLPNPRYRFAWSLA